MALCIIDQILSPTLSSSKYWNQVNFNFSTHRTKTNQNENANAVACLNKVPLTGRITGRDYKQAEFTILEHQMTLGFIKCCKKKL